MSRAGEPAVTESFQAQGSRSAHVPGAEDGDLPKDIAPVEETVGSGFG